MSAKASYCASCGKEIFPEGRYCTYCGTAQPEGKELRPAEGSRRVSEIQQVGIWSLVKFAFMIHVVIGLMFSILFVTIGMTGLPFPPDSRLLPFGAIPWMSAIIVIPLIYGLIGAFLGFCAGSTYNLLAWGIGGIRITLKES